ncbi:protein FAM184A-like [Narcine bancroftii]|uniref:protein FAM184A-like n=1 Tax=Narcine bancroftii TaxID=1343680 RepID=UPI00383195E7
MVQAHDGLVAKSVVQRLNLVGLCTGAGVGQGIGGVIELPQLILNVIAEHGQLNSLVQDLVVFDLASVGDAEHEGHRTLVIYALNTKNDEHEASLQAMKEVHQEEIQRIIAETRRKILQYKNKMGEEVDLRHQIQTLEDTLEKLKKSKEEVLVQFEVYKQQVAEREKNTEREHTERIVALSREMLNIKKEFESNLQHFMEIQRRLEQDKQSAITEIVKVNQESENLQEKCKALGGCFDEKYKLEEKPKPDVQCLSQELEVLKSEKIRLTSEFEKKVSKLQVTHQKELETLKKALQQSVTETLKQWQAGQKKSQQAQEMSLQIKLKKLESDAEIKDQMICASKSQCQKLQELLNAAELKIQDLKNQLQKADNKLATSNENLRKMENEVQLLRERLLEQKAEILHITGRIKSGFHCIFCKEYHRNPDLSSKSHDPQEYEPSF